MPSPTKATTRKRKDYKKLYEGTRAELKKLEAEFQKRIAETENIQDQIDMLREQEKMSKKAMNLMSLEVERYKFRPHQYSKIAQILNCLHVNFNPRQKQALENHIGSSSIIDARKAIFELLEAPYDE